MIGVDVPAMSDGVRSLFDRIQPPPPIVAFPFRYQGAQLLLAVQWLMRAKDPVDCVFWVDLGHPDIWSRGKRRVHCDLVPMVLPLVTGCSGGDTGDGDREAKHVLGHPSVSFRLRPFEKYHQFMLGWSDNDPHFGNFAAVVAIDCAVEMPADTVDMFVRFVA